MKIVLRGSISYNRRKLGVKPVFFSLPKPDTYNIKLKKSKLKQTETMIWRSSWTNPNECKKVMEASNRKVEYYSSLLDLFVSMKNDFPDLTHINDLIKMAKVELEKWTKVNHTIVKQIKG